MASDGSVPPRGFRDRRMISKLGSDLRRHAKRLSPDERVAAERSAAALVQTGEAFCDQLLALLRAQTATTAARASACWMLRALGYRRAIPTLLKIVQDRHLDSLLRHEAVQALGVFRSKRAV